MSIPDFANEPVVRPASSSQVEDLITVVHSPTTAFEHRRDGRYGIALLVVVVVSVALYLLSRSVIMPYVEADMMRGMHAKMASNPQFTEAMAQKSVDMVSKFGVLGVAVMAPIMMLIVALALWLCGKIFDSRQTYSQAAAVAVLSSVPRVLQAVVNWAQALLINNPTPASVQQLSLSPARFVDPAATNPALFVLLSRFDLFTLWATVLLGIGLSVTGRISRANAMLAAFLVWALATALMCYQAA